MGRIKALSKGNDGQTRRACVIVCKKSEYQELQKPEVHFQLADPSAVLDPGQQSDVMYQRNIAGSNPEPRTTTAVRATNGIKRFVVQLS